MKVLGSPERLEIAPGRFIGPDDPVLIIAEIGQNHQGDLNTAKEMILAAQKAGVDCVKFQKSSLKDKFNAAALRRPYTGPNSWGETYGQHKEYLEFSEDEFIELQQYSRELGLLFTASAMDEVSAKFLHKINVPFIKIGSGDVNNLKLLRLVAGFGKPLVISTGMSDMNWVRVIHKTVSDVTKKFVLLQCTSSYPTPPEHVNLSVIHQYRKNFPDIHIGYSGHEVGVCISVAAVALGARVIERHFTLDKTWKGSDHKCSLDHKEMQLLVGLIRGGNGIRRIHESRQPFKLTTSLTKPPVKIGSGEDLVGVEEILDGIYQHDVDDLLKKAMGTEDKRFQESEKACQEKLGKSLVAARKLVKGTVLREDLVNIKVAEPNGVDPRCVNEWDGKLLAADVEEDETITKHKLVWNF